MRIDPKSLYHGDINLDAYRRRRKLDRAERKLISVGDKMVNIVIVLICAILLFVGLYGLYDSEMLAQDAAAVKFTSYRPGVESTVSFEDFQSQNPDVSGWVDIYGTDINYPIMYSKNPEEYLTKNPLGEYSLLGSLFFDTRSDPALSHLESIVYGHHSQANGKGIMLGTLDLFVDYNYFHEHEYGYVYGGNTHYGATIVAYLEGIDAYDEQAYRTGIIDPSAEKEYLDYLMTFATHVRLEEMPTGEDKILILSTCSTDGTNYRSMLVLKLTDDIKPNTFVGWPFEGTGLLSNPVIIPWYWFAAVLFSACLILILYRRYWLVDIGRQAKRKHAREEKLKLKNLRKSPPPSNPPSA